MPQFRCKQVLVFRSDLKMSKGKLAAQAGHAAVSASEKTRKHRKNWWKTWIREGQCKIALKVKNEDHLLNLKKKAEKLNLPSALVTDRGLTELHPGSKTCLAIGPAPPKQIDKITGNLPLL